MTESRASRSALLARALLGDAAVLDGEDARTLAAAADDHGIGALLWLTLDGRKGHAADVRKALDPEVHAAVARDLLVRRDMRAVLESLHLAGVPTLVIKGSGLAYTLYTHAWLRPRVDTDLLVREDTVPAAERALEGCGYSRCDAISTGVHVSHQVAFERTDDHGAYHVVDLHWKIANPQVVADSLPFDVLWHDAEPAPALGPHARVPSHVGSILLGCIHRLAHHQGYDRLIWLYDLKLLTSSLDDAGWTALRDLARARRVAGLCLDGLREAHRRLAAPLPADVEAALAAAAPGEPSHAYVEGPVRKVDVLASDLRMLESWRARVRLLREHAFPPAAFMRQRYRTNARWLLPAYYAHRLVTGAVRWVRT